MKHTRTTPRNSDSTANRDLQECVPAGGLGDVVGIISKFSLQAYDTIQFVSVSSWS